MKKLTIIGVNHYQQGLYDKLISAFNELNPEAIGIEYSNPKRVLRLYDELSLNTFKNIFLGLEDNQVIGQEVKSVINYNKYYQRIPVYCVDRFNKAGRIIIPLIKSRAPKSIKLLMISLTNKFREKGIKDSVNKLLKKYDDVLLIIGEGHVKSLNNLLKEGVIISNYQLRN